MFSKRQLQTISIVPHFTAGLSLVGSSTLVGYLCLYDTNQHGEILDSTHKRLMLGLSIFDILGSIGFFLSTWPIDKDTVYAETGEKRNEYVFGNDQTCQIQGFLIQLAISAALYNVMVALNCLMVTHYRIPSDIIAAKYEMFMHGVAITFGIGVAMAGIPLHLYNNSALWCWIATDKVNDSDGNQVGGVKENHWRSFRFLFYYGPAWLSAIIITAMMYFFLKVIWMLNNSRHFMSKSGQKKIDRQIRDHTNQVIFLIFAFYLTYIPGTINRFFDLTDTKAPFWLVCLISSISLIL